MGVAYQMNKNWMRRVPYLSAVPKYMIEQVALLLGSFNVSQNEAFGQNFMLYILNQGSVARYNAKKKQNITLLHPGSVWGEEHLLLTAWFLLTPNTARAVVFSEVLTLDRESFETLCDDFPDCAPIFRKWYLWYTLKHGILHVVGKHRDMYSSVATEES